MDRSIAARRFDADFSASPLQTEELFLGQEEEIGRIANQTARHELCDHFFPQSFDVQSAPGDKMGDTLADLGRTGDTDASVGGFALDSDDARTALGTGVRHDEGSFRSGSHRFDDLDHLGNDVARPVGPLTVSPIRISFLSISS